MVQDDKRAEISPLILMDLLVTLLDYIEGGCSGALSHAEKYKWPITFATAYKFDYCLDLLVHFCHLLLISNRNIFLPEEQIVLYIAIVVAYNDVNITKMSISLAWKGNFYNPVTHLLTLLNLLIVIRY